MRVVGYCHVPWLLVLLFIAYGGLVVVAFLSKTQATLLVVQWQPRPPWLKLAPAEGCVRSTRWIWIGYLVVNWCWGTFLVFTNRYSNPSPPHITRRSFWRTLVARLRHRPEWWTIINTFFLLGWGCNQITTSTTPGLWLVFGWLLVINTHSPPIQFRHRTANYQCKVCSYCPECPGCSQCVTTPTGLSMATTTTTETALNDVPMGPLATVPSIRPEGLDVNSQWLEQVTSKQNQQSPRSQQRRLSLHHLAARIDWDHLGQTPSASPDSHRIVIKTGIVIPPVRAMSPSCSPSHSTSDTSASSMIGYDTDDNRCENHANPIWHGEDDTSNEYNHLALTHPRWVNPCSADDSASDSEPLYNSQPPFDQHIVAPCRKQPTTCPKMERVGGWIQRTLLHIRQPLSPLVVNLDQPPIGYGGPWLIMFACHVVVIVNNLSMTTANGVGGLLLVITPITSFRLSKTSVLPPSSVLQSIKWQAAWLITMTVYWLGVSLVPSRS
jgi:hypothetical protein